MLHFMERRIGVSRLHLHIFIHHQNYTLSTLIVKGGAFPTKWYWAQCNSFDNHLDLAFTAGGGIRQLPFSFPPGKKTETLGLIGIHYNGTFYEIVPWTGEMDWKVWPWGRWEFRGRCTNKSGMQFEAEVVAVTDVPGVLLRAPTKDEGMVRQHFNVW